MTDDDNEQPTKLSLLSVIGSAFSAALGVQNSKNRERDFKSGKMMPFIIAGVIFTLVFIGTVFTVVSVVLKNVGH
jgi:Protein of unknown function (DUF2970)